MLKKGMKEPYLLYTLLAIDVKEARKTVTPPSEGHSNISRHQRNSPPGTIVPHYLSLGRINGDLGKGGGPLILFIARNLKVHLLCVFLPL